MHKKQKAQRKLRKSEKGIPTKSNNRGCKYRVTKDGRWLPFL
jgi:hypothetical protein